jgi:hypothetical protein
MPLQTDRISWDLIESGLAGFEPGITDVSTDGGPMATCAYCGTAILFGGVKDGTRRYCNSVCQHQGILQRGAQTAVPEDVLTREVERVHKGTCPRCGGPGPVDVHDYHSVWSAIVVTRYVTKSMVCCQSCGKKAKLGAAGSSLVLGWWGFPFGLIITPFQIGRNLVGVFKPPDPMAPSDRLVDLVRGHIVSNIRPAVAPASPFSASPRPPQ